MGKFSQRAMTQLGLKEKIVSAAVFYLPLLLSGLPNKVTAAVSWKITEWWLPSRLTA